MIYEILDNKIVEFDPNKVEYLYSKYVPNGSLIIASVDQLNYLELPPEITCIIVDSSNPIDINQFIEFEYKNPKKIYILSGIYDYYKKVNPQVQFFPFWAIWMSEPYAPVMPMGSHGFSDKIKKYKVSCLNGTQWAHRKLTYLHLSQKDYFNEMIFTFNLRKEWQWLTTEIKLTQSELDALALLPPEVKFLDDDNTIGIDISTNHPAYQETYVNLVTETTVSLSTPMLSEKTFKPIIAGQLFVLIASPGAVQFLRDAGIDTFDDVIDHSYDNILDTRTRILSALVQVDRLSQMDLKELYDQIKPRLERNSDYFLSQEFRNRFLLRFN